MNKKYFPIVCLLAILLPSCSDNTKEDSKQTGEYAGMTLTIYNCEDYISTTDNLIVERDENGNEIVDPTDLIRQFEIQTGCTIKYNTYDTNETMHNQYSLQKEGTYDLICTSEYMIQKMIKEGQVEPMADKSVYVPNYQEYAGKAVRNKLKTMKVEPPSAKEGDPKVPADPTLDDYVVGYMWGTLGLIYDADFKGGKIEEDIKSWDILWNKEYDNTISIKNSIRDAFVPGLMHRYSKDSEFQQLMKDYLNDKNIDKYTQKVQEIFDFDLSVAGDYDNESGLDRVTIKKNLDKIQAVKEELINQKDNIFGYETDSGKNDIVTGTTVKINLAYSGDATYSIQLGKENGKNLKYAVPFEGSNIWYDAWFLPKGFSKKSVKQQELAYKFLDFISDPDNAAVNMDYIGYTPFIMSDSIFTLVADYYGAADYFDGAYYTGEVVSEIDEECVDGSLVIYEEKLYKCIQDSEGNLPTNEEYFECLEFDLSTSYEEEDMLSYQGKIYNCIQECSGILPSNEEYFIEVEPYDLSHVFKENIDDSRRPIIYPYLGWENCLECQYPSSKIIARCAIFNDFGNITYSPEYTVNYNDLVVIMWGQIKAYTNMVPVYIILISFLVVVTIGATIYYVDKKRSARWKRQLSKK